MAGAGRPHPGWCGWYWSSPLQSPVKDADHVLGPLAGREAIRPVEAGEPVFGISFAHDEERRRLLAHGETPVYLGSRWPLRCHR